MNSLIKWLASLLFLMVVSCIVGCAPSEKCEMLKSDHEQVLGMKYSEFRTVYGSPELAIWTHLSWPYEGVAAELAYCDMWVQVTLRVLQATGETYVSSVRVLDESERERRWIRGLED